MVSHTPRVKSGWGAGATATYGAFGELKSNDPSEVGMPVGMLWARHGWISKPDGAAFLIGVQAPPYAYAMAPPIGLSYTELDGYIQLPERWTGKWSAGAGILAAEAHLMPYVQLGELPESGRGWYATQGVRLVPKKQVDAAGWDGPMWLSSMAAQLPTEYGFAHPTIALGVGRTSQERQGGHYTHSHWHWLVMGGVTIELHRSRKQRTNQMP